MCLDRSSHKWMKMKHYCISSFTLLKIVPKKLPIWRISEWNITKWPHWKMNKIEDDQNGRWLQWKMTTMGDNQNGRWPQWMMTPLEDDHNGRWPKYRMTTMEVNLNLKMTIVEDVHDRLCAQWMMKDDQIQ